ncbi:class I SAM-dependent methyltransferase [Leptotrichia shahii]|jgi:methionine biosynthesis protein metW|uniref:class I SAM-dependent methyltransferase n=1 Tax=Leptotrichia shahii TaxID=157691 RepID=UPI0028D2C220|nr:class I SAM-dependent methyltransferase [Leptotrichia shahii]
MEIKENDFEINIDNINVEEIMNKIRQNIKDKGYVEEEKINNFDFTPKISEEDNFRYDIDVLNRVWNINLEREILSRNKLFAFVKKVIRKLTRWYIVPMMQDQITFNSYVVRNINNLNKQNEKIRQILDEKDEKIRQILDEKDERIKKLEKIEKENNFDMDYLAFENKYRGSEKSIQKLQEKFVRLYAGKDNILDIGCGRGEFIKTLLNAGKQYVFGMDINPQMVEKCKKEGLSVELKDGVNYLYDNDNLNLGGIFSSQVIEHLKPSQIVKLIKGAHKNLQEGSPLILETINPMALVTQTMAYTLDLTHRQYVHPFTIEMLLKEHGFKKVEFIYSSPVDIEAPVLKDNDMDPKELEKYNEKIRRMHEMLFGYQDYAVIAWK